MSPLQEAPFFMMCSMLQVSSCEWKTNFELAKEHKMAKRKTFLIRYHLSWEKFVVFMHETPEKMRRKGDERDSKNKLFFDSNSK